MKKSLLISLLLSLSLAAFGQMTAEEMLAKGDNYYEGKNGVARNHAMAVKWYQQAAEKGNAEAQNQLGYCYFQGEGIQQNFEEALKWFKKAAENGSAKGQTNLAACYHKGETVEQSYEEAFKWYTAAAKQGYASAQFNLGLCYENGEGTDTSFTDAVKSLPSYKSLTLFVSGEVTDLDKLKEDLLKKYDLINFEKSYPKELSGGMRQRVALIRTLAINPDILFLDEPFSALDYQTRLSLSDEIYQIIKKEKKTVIMVTHDIGEAISMSDRIIILTKRPGTIKNIYSIELKNKDTPTKNRTDEYFLKYYDLLWKELDHNV